MLSLTKKYSVAVIGGGSGGLASAKLAGSYNKSVICFDYVAPSTQGNTWGIGGTCVNVGCIPKKLFHCASKLSSDIKHNLPFYGWDSVDHCSISETHNWTTLKNNVQNYIKSLNFSYRRGLKSAGVDYVNAQVSFLDSKHLEYELNGKKHIIEFENVIIATGGRPHIPSDVLGAKEHAITTDDIFFLEKLPAKTLIVGTSYIALEVGGFLTSLGSDVTICVRSIPLRAFDRQCADLVVENMEDHGTYFKYHDLPIEIKKLNDSKFEVTFSSGQVEIYDIVIYATGRSANIAALNLEKAGVILKKDVYGSKILTDDYEATNVPGIYSIGDVAYGRSELTPVAIKSGENLVSNLFSDTKNKLDYKLIPTVVFSPVEYGTVGYSEEEAIDKFGEDNIEVFLYRYNSVENTAASWKKPNGDSFRHMSFSKLVCLKNENMKVIGFHAVSPNAGEMTQGYALAMRVGVTKKDFDDTVGIHPTEVESFHSLNITKRSGKSFVATGGCGGGKCG